MGRINGVYLSGGRRKMGTPGGFKKRAANSGGSCTCAANGRWLGASNNLDNNQSCYDDLSSDDNKKPIQDEVGWSIIQLI